MTTGLAGIGGAHFPSRYLIDRLGDDAGPWTSAEALDRRRRQFIRWWSGVADSCGPASGLRALFDLIAMPMAGMLGFRARNAVFERRSCRATLETPAGTRLGLVLLPWGDRAPGLWRDASDLAHDIGGAWCFVLAPPFLSLVEARGHATRRSADFMWPDALAPGSFPVFFTLTHASAFDGGPDQSRLHALLASASHFQDRVRHDLQHGVVEALDAFQAVVSSRTPSSRFDEALTLIYRILFLLFAESRQLVPKDDPIYHGAYAVGTLCRTAGGVHQGGQWQGLAAITRLSRLGCRTADLVVHPFNGRLFARAAAPSLEAPAGPRSRRREVRQDEAARRALVALGSRRGSTSREDISYRDLGVEELGAVYERVLDLDNPSRSSSDRATVNARRRGVHSALRKQTGTFYTPRALAEYLVRRTLEPLVAGRSPDSILDLRVVDPAAGSGAFLVAACRYLAEAYERALLAEGRVHTDDIDDGMRADFKRLIAARCLVGVDRNPVAIQLARLSLWLTTLAKGKPLGFLDHRLRVGNSIVGASPHDLVRAPQRRARTQAGLPLFDQLGYEHAVGDAMVPLFKLGVWRDDTVGDVRAKERLWSAIAGTASPLSRWKIAANAWCAHWFWTDADTTAPGAAELRAIVDAVLRGDRVLPTAHLAKRLSSVAELADRQAFFHWPLEFPDVFHDEQGAPKTRPGFDAVIGNPPWEMVRDDSGGRALVRYIRESGIFPSCDRGHVNLYQPFLERALSLTRPGGRVGLVLPWGLCVDDGATALRRRLLDHCAIDSLVGVTNSARLFPIHSSLRFAVIVASPGSKTIEFPARFGVTTASELDDLPARNTVHPAAFAVRLTGHEIAKIGGRALRMPDVRHPSDLRLLERLFDEFPKLGDGPWAARFGRELNATEDRPHFGPNGLPVIEGKHLDPFRVRLESVTTRIEPATAGRLLPDGRFDRLRLGYRDVSGATNKLSLIAALIPPGVVTTHTVLCLRSPATEDALHFLCGLFNSFVLNVVVRALMGSHVTASQVEDLPVPAWDPSDDRARRIAGLSRALTMAPDRTTTRTVLQAEVAKLYRIEIEDFRRALEGFPLVAKEEREGALRALERLENQV